ncbi:MAG TPA: RT0821/Lpp0805 family surface protein [Hyphomicrobiales bacterium]|nr:RT0821/Lpp0805 family surface protein [Hyphomicrobiales bacterium]
MPCASLYRRLRPARRALVPVAAALLLAGCSLSMPLGSLVGSRDPGPATTASTTPLKAAPAGTIVSAPLPAPDADKPATAANAPLARAFTATDGNGTTGFSATDWVYARGALGLALSGDGKGPPVPWANPDTGTHGNFAAAAPPVTSGASTCRAFVAERFVTGRQEHLSGRACRSESGAWDIAEIRADPAAQPDPLAARG